MSYSLIQHNNDAKVKLTELVRILKSFEIFDDEQILIQIIENSAFRRIFEGDKFAIQSSFCQILTQAAREDAQFGSLCETADIDFSRYKANVFYADDTTWAAGSLIDIAFGMGCAPIEVQRKLVPLRS